MTPEDMKYARRQLGLSVSGMAEAVNCSSERTVRRWEDGTREISGTTERLVDILLNVPAAREYLGLK